MVESRNWKEYNDILVNRGRIINIYVSAELCQKDDIKGRQIQGFLEDIGKYVIDMIAPNFRTVWWRIKNSGKKNFCVIKHISNNDKLEIAIDSTGMKFSNDGEYLGHVYKKKKEWIKLHIVVDVNTHDIVNAKITKRKVGDSQEFVNLLSPISANASEIYADGAYDSNDIFEYVDCRDIYPNIAVHLNASKHCSKARRKAVIEQLGLIGDSGTRDIVKNYTKEYRRKHQEKWRKDRKHGRRWAVETVFSSFKQMFGESVYAKKFNMIQKEIYTKILLYNRIHA